MEYRRSVAALLLDSTPGYVAADDGDVAETVGLWLLRETAPAEVCYDIGECDFTDTTCDYEDYVCSETRPTLSGRHRLSYASGEHPAISRGFGERLPASISANQAGSLFLNYSAADGQSTIELQAAIIFGPALYVDEREAEFLAPEPSSHVLVAGDINGDGSGPNVSDIIYLARFLLESGNPPPEDTRDLNGFSGLDLSDLQYLVNYVFRGGPAPVVGTQK
jgi:hypothetical protein